MGAPEKAYAEAALFRWLLAQHRELTFSRRSIVVWS
jgi:hypothetical protein